MGRTLLQEVLTFGCDPEFFFQDSKGIIGAENVLKDGQLIDLTYTNAAPFVLDGVQVELHPRPNPCRANLANEMVRSFQMLKYHLSSVKGVKASFDSVITMDKAVLDALSEQAKKFGCAPSLCAYSNSPDSTIKLEGVDASQFLQRSAGGHIHLGLSDWVKPYRRQLVPLLDVLVGNTSVLIDRNPLAAERRKLYGRAGEFREPTHGLEYRTLSNFWLTSYQLMSLMMGLCRMAHAILVTSLRDAETSPVRLAYEKYVVSYAHGGMPLKYAWKPRPEMIGWNAGEELLRLVNLDDIQKAINENDFNLARENFDKIKPFITKHIPWTEQGMGLNMSFLKKFDTFIDKIDEKGIKYWFPMDPLEHWTTTFSDGHERGWESWIQSHVM